MRARSTKARVISRMNFSPYVLKYIAVCSRHTVCVYRWYCYGTRAALRACLTYVYGDFIGAFGGWLYGGRKTVLS